MQHKTSFWFGVFYYLHYPPLSFSTQCDTFSAVLSPAVLYWFSSMSFDEKSVIVSDN